MDRELAIHRSLTHNNIVELLGTFEDKERVFLVEVRWATAPALPSMSTQISASQGVACMPTPALHSCLHT